MDVLSSSDTSIVEFLLILVESEYGNTDRKPMSFRYQETLKMFYDKFTSVLCQFVTGIRYRNADV